VWVRGNDGVRLGVGKRLSQINNGGFEGGSQYLIMVGVWRVF